LSNTTEAWATGSSCPSRRRVGLHLEADEALAVAGGVVGRAGSRPSALPSTSPVAGLIASIAQLIVSVLGS
jgi:hypothetical protein